MPSILNVLRPAELVNCRDFLGSILGTGIERSKVGDIIILGETGAQILVAAELVEHFEQSLTQVGLFMYLAVGSHTLCKLLLAVQRIHEHSASFYARVCLARLMSVPLPLLLTCTCCIAQHLTDTCSPCEQRPEIMQLS